MDDQQRYQDAVQRLDLLGYDVIPNPPGYIVRHRNDPNDTSQTRHLDDLEDLAKLIEWRARR